MSDDIKLRGAIDTRADVGGSDSGLGGKDSRNISATQPEWSTHLRTVFRMHTLDRNHLALPVLWQISSATPVTGVVVERTLQCEAKSVEQVRARQKTLQLTHLMQIHGDKPQAHAITLAADDLRLTLDARTRQLEPELHQLAWPEQPRRV